MQGYNFHLFSVFLNNAAIKALINWVKKMDWKEAEAAQNTEPMPKKSLCFLEHNVFRTNSGKSSVPLQYKFKFHAE